MGLEQGHSIVLIKVAKRYDFSVSEHEKEEGKKTISKCLFSSFQKENG